MEFELPDPNDVALNTCDYHTTAPDDAVLVEVNEIDPQLASADREPRDEQLSPSSPPPSFERDRSLTFSIESLIEREELFNDQLPELSIVEFQADSAYKIYRVKKGTLHRVIDSLVSRDNNDSANSDPESVRRKKRPLKARDIRQMYSSLVDLTEPSITLRDRIILFSMGSVRVIILRDRCYFLVPDGADEILQIAMTKLRQTPDSSSRKIAFEFRALEVALFTACGEISHAIATVERQLDTLLRQVLSSLASEPIEKVRAEKIKLSELMGRSKPILLAIQAILDEEDELGMLYLTRLYHDPESFSRPGVKYFFNEAVMLLESSAQDIQNSMYRLKQMILKVEHTEDLVKLKMDQARNRMMSLDLLMSLLTLSCSIGAVITGTFGMNLMSGVESNRNIFLDVVYSIIAITVIFGFGGYVLLLKTGFLYGSGGR